MGAIDTIDRHARSAPSSRPTGKRPIDRLRMALLWLEAVLEKRRTRRALLALTDEQLKDIGISRADAYREAVKPFWD